jgi:hypothetical protein
MVADIESTPPQEGEVLVALVKEESKTHKDS